VLIGYWDEAELAQEQSKREAFRTNSAD